MLGALHLCNSIIFEGIITYGISTSIDKLDSYAISV